tara:strand:+ start:77 stop:220 length:144 start_codon:yes stop_codon:yes gene_type:complete
MNRTTNYVEMQDVVEKSACSQQVRQIKHVTSGQQGNVEKNLRVKDYV